jgi:hypothetical protein
MYGDLPLGLRHRKHASPSLQFTFMGPRLYVNTMQVISSFTAHSDTIMLKISILTVIYHCSDSLVVETPNILEKNK